MKPSRHIVMRRGSSVGVAKGYGMDCRDSIPGKDKIFLFCTACPPNIQWVTGALFPEVKRLGHEADHSPPSSAEAKNVGAIHPLHLMPAWLSA
jgi:hypothetical protein